MANVRQQIRRKMHFFTTENRKFSFEKHKRTPQTRVFLFFFACSQTVQQITSSASLFPSILSSSSRILTMSYHSAHRALPKTAVTRLNGITTGLYRSGTFSNMPRRLGKRTSSRIYGCTKIENVLFA